MQPPATAPNARRPAFVFEVLAAATVYFATARLGLELAVVARPVSIIWPATGLALALLILRGRRLWPAVLLGAFASNALNETSIFTSAGIAIGNTLEALVGATLLQRVGFLPSMRRLHDVASLFLLAACLSTMVSATIGVITVCLGGTTSWHDFTSLWSTWWIGDAIGNLVTAPFVFVWADQARNRWRLQRLAEGMLLLFSMGFLSLAVFVDHGSEVPYPVHYLIFPAVIWAALRLGQHATATLVFGALASLWVSRQVAGPFYRLEKDLESLLHGAKQGQKVASLHRGILFFGRPAKGGAGRDRISRDDAKATTAINAAVARGALLRSA